MTAAQPAGAGDAIRLECIQRGGQRRHAGKMGAVGAGARHDLGIAVKDECGVATLNRVGDRLDTVDQRPLVARFEADENGSDVAGGDDVADRPRQRRGISEA